MNYPWLEEYCLSLKGTVRDYKEEWEAVRFLLDGKMYAMVGGDKQGRPIVTLKLEPNHGRLMREQFPDVSPGYYMNKDHWNSVLLEGNLPDDVLRDMLAQSHKLVLGSLPKKKQQELLEG